MQTETLKMSQNKLILHVSLPILSYEETSRDIYKKLHTIATSIYRSTRVKLQNDYSIMVLSHSSHNLNPNIN